MCYIVCLTYFLPTSNLVMWIVLFIIVFNAILRLFDDCELKKVSGSTEQMNYISLIFKKLFVCFYIELCWLNHFSWMKTHFKTKKILKLDLFIY